MANRKRGKLLGILGGVTAIGIGVAAGKGTLAASFGKLKQGVGAVLGPIGEKWLPGVGEALAGSRPWSDLFPTAADVRQEAEDLYRDTPAGQDATRKERALWLGKIMSHPVTWVAVGLGLFLLLRRRG